MVFTFLLFSLCSERFQRVRKTRRINTAILPSFTIQWFIWKCGVFSIVSRFYITWKLWPLSLYCCGRLCVRVWQRWLAVCRDQRWITPSLFGLCNVYVCVCVYRDALWGWRAWRLLMAFAARGGGMHWSGARHMCIRLRIYQILALLHRVFGMTDYRGLFIGPIAPSPASAYACRMDSRKVNFRCPSAMGSRNSR